MSRVVVLLIAIGCSSSHDPAPAPTPPSSPFAVFDTAAPRVGELAPDFTLADPDGRVVKLGDAVARGPVVLVWGSFT